MPVRICVAIGEQTTGRAVAAMKRAVQWADLLEIRADYIRDLELEQLLRDRPRPLIFTLRSRHEGGSYDGLEDDRLETIARAARMGVEFVDIEFSANYAEILRVVPKARVILSSHDFESTPVGLEKKLDAMASTGAGVLKIVTRALRLSDNMRVARLLNYSTMQRWNVIAFAMGREGIPSRILGPRWGSYLTFASLPGGEPTADGQIPADELIDLYRARQIDNETRFYGVLGRPLSHSLSPAIHNAVFSSRGLNAVFFPMEASGVEDFWEFQESFGLHGLSVTIPYKEDVRTRIQSLSRNVERIGAVNTLARTEKGWHADNTDVEGFLRPIRKRMRLGSRSAAVLGSGGAARAAVFGLRTEEARVSIVARNEAKGKSLAREFGASFVPWEHLRSARWDLLVNATPVGMYPDIEASPIPEDWLDGEWVYDLVYNPRETRLIRDAARRGCRTICGTEMFIGQALEQQRIWFGWQGPEDVMQEAMQRALCARQREE